MVKKTPANSTAFLARSVGYVGRVVHVPGHKLGKSRPGIPGIRGYHGDRVVGLQIAAFSLILTTSKSWDPPSTMGHYRTPTPNAIFFEGNQRTFILYLHQLWCPLKMGNRWPKTFCTPETFFARWVLQQNANTPEDFTPVFFQKLLYQKKINTRDALQYHTAGRQPAMHCQSVRPDDTHSGEEICVYVRPTYFWSKNPYKTRETRIFQKLKWHHSKRFRFLSTNYFFPTLEVPAPKLLQAPAASKLVSNQAGCPRKKKDARLIPGRRKSPASVHWNKPTIQTSWRFLSWD